jgi:hypothetical protein
VVDVDVEVDVVVVGAPVVVVVVVVAQEPFEDITPNAPITLNQFVPSE